MSSNSISFSVTGFSDIMYGAAILTGIYAGVTIIQEFFSYKKEELYVKAQLPPPTKFDIAGDIRSREDNKFVCRECLRSKHFSRSDFSRKTIDGNLGRIVHDENTVHTEHHIPAETMLREDSKKLPKNNTVVPADCGPKGLSPRGITNLAVSNNTLAEVVDLGDNGFHLLEEYGG